MSDTPSLELAAAVEILQSLQPSYSAIDVILGAAWLPASASVRISIAASFIQKIDSNTLYFSEIHSILQKENLNSSKESFEGSISRIVAESTDTSNENGQVVDLKTRFHQHVLDSTELAILQQTIKLIPKQSALFIFDAEIYQDHAYQFGTKEQIAIPADAWLPNIARSMPALYSLAKENELYIVLICSKTPMNHEFYDVINSLGTNSNVLTIKQKLIREIVSDNYENWSRAIETGKTERALLEIDQMNIPIMERKILRGYILLKADRGDAAFAEVQTCLNWANAQNEAFAFIVIINIALDTERREIAHNLIESMSKCSLNKGEFIALLKFVQTLNINLQSLNIEMPDYEDLLASFSNSAKFDEALTALTRDALSRGQIALASELIAKHRRPSQVNTKQFTILLIELIEALLLLDPINPKNDDESQEDSDSSTSEPTKHQQQNSLNSSEINERTATIIQQVVRFLGTHPEEVQMRNRLGRVFSPQSAGNHGMVLLVHRVLNSDGAVIKKRITESLADETEIDAHENQRIIEFFLRQLMHVNKEGPFLLGVGDISTEGLPYNVRCLLRILTSFLEFIASNRIDDDDDIQFLLKILHISILLAKKAGEDVLDLRLLTVAAGGLASAGRFQMARNLAEQGIAMLGREPSARRCRTAWYQFADINHKAGDMIDSLIALACATSISNVEISPEEAYLETTLWIRILRDIGLPKLTDGFFKTATRLLSLHSSEQHYEHRLILLEASVKVRSLSSNSTDKELEDIVNQLLDASQKARSLNDELFPITVLLAQMEIIIAEHFVSHNQCEMSNRITDEIRISCNYMGEPNASRIRMLSSKGPTIIDIQDLVKNLEQTLYSEDIGRDVHTLVHMARRALKNSHEVEEVLYLLEAMTEHAIRLPHEEDADEYPANEAVTRLLSTELSKITETELAAALERYQELQQSLLRGSSARATRLIHNPQDLRTFLEHASQKGTTFHVLGMDAGHNLVRVSTTNGRSYVADEPKDKFEIESFREWRKDYPFAYHEFKLHDPHGYHRLERTLNGFGIDDEKMTDPVILIPEQELQIVPANLFISGKEPIGYNVPTASAPSVAWLMAAHSTPRLSNGVRRAWIPVEADYSDFSALRALHDAVTPALQEHGFTVSNNAELPEDGSNSDVIILGAHGRLGLDRRFFRLLANEGAFRVTAREVARRLRHSGLVVLFVCSGGRLDTHPFARATVGLPRMLLHYGCRAVVASAWPLDISIPSRWLPTFLRELDTGLPLVQAVFRANKAVRSFIDHPAAFLAMNVYGDPFWCVPPKPRKA